MTTERNRIISQLVFEADVTDLTSSAARAERDLDNLSKSFDEVRLEAAAVERERTVAQRQGDQQREKSLGIRQRELRAEAGEIQLKRRIVQEEVNRNRAVQDLSRGNVELAESERQVRVGRDLSTASLSDKVQLLGEEKRFAQDGIRLNTQFANSEQLTFNQRRRAQQQAIQYSKQIAPLNNQIGRLRQQQADESFRAEAAAAGQTYDVRGLNRTIQGSAVLGDRSLRIGDLSKVQAQEALGSLGVARTRYQSALTAAQGRPDSPTRNQAIAAYTQVLETTLPDAVGNLQRHVRGVEEGERQLGRTQRRNRLEATREEARITRRERLRTRLQTDGAGALAEAQVYEAGANRRLGRARAELDRGVEGSQRNFRQAANEVRFYSGQVRDIEGSLGRQRQKEAEQQNRDFQQTRQRVAIGAGAVGVGLVGGAAGASVLGIHNAREILRASGIGQLSFSEAQREQLRLATSAVENPQNLIEEYRELSVRISDATRDPRSEAAVAFREFGLSPNRLARLNSRQIQEVLISRSRALRERGDIRVNDLLERTAGDQLAEFFIQQVNTPQNIVNRGNRIAGGFTTVRDTSLHQALTLAQNVDELRFSVKALSTEFAASFAPAARLAAGGLNALLSTGRAVLDTPLGPILSTSAIALGTVAAAAGGVALSWNVLVGTGRTLNTIFSAQTALQLANARASLVSSFASGRDAVAKGIASVANAGYTASVASATRATFGFTAALLANPLGLALTVAGAGVGLALYKRYQSRAQAEAVSGVDAYDNVNTVNIAGSPNINANQVRLAADEPLATTSPFIRSILAAFFPNPATQQKALEGVLARPTPSSSFLEEQARDAFIARGFTTGRGGFGVRNNYGQYYDEFLREQGFALDSEGKVVSLNGAATGGGSTSSVADGSGSATIGGIVQDQFGAAGGGVQPFNITNAEMYVENLTIVREGAAVGAAEGDEDPAAETTARFSGHGGFIGLGLLRAVGGF